MKVAIENLYVNAYSTALAVVAPKSVYGCTNWDSFVSGKLAGNIWDFEFDNPIALDSGTLAVPRELSIRWFVDRWVDDKIRFYISKDGGLTWSLLEEWSETNPPPTTATVKTYDVSAILDTWAKLGLAMFRIEIVAVAKADDFEIHVYWIKISIPYEPDLTLPKIEQNILPDDPKEIVYTHTYKLAGDFVCFPLPITLYPPYAPEWEPMTSAEEDTLSSDDCQAVEREIYLAVGETGFNNVMIKTVFPVYPNEFASLLRRIRLGCMGTYDPACLFKTVVYLWNFATATWDKIDEIEDWRYPDQSYCYTKDIMAIAGWENYISGKTMYMVLEDATGVVRTEGCLVKGTPILTPEGFKPIEEIKIGERIIGYNVFKLREEETLVTGRSFHYGKFKVWNWLGIKFASNHLIWDVGARCWNKVSELTKKREEYMGEVYNLQTQLGTFISKHKVVIHNLYKW